MEWLKENNKIISIISFVIFNIGFPILAILSFREDQRYSGYFFFFLSLAIWGMTLYGDKIMQKLTETYYSKL